jgi:hypothetical protein
MTQNDVLTALRAFLLLIVPAGTQVIAAQDNGVPMPLDPFISMNLISVERLSTNHTDYPGTNEALQTAPSKITVQLDCYGADSGDTAARIMTMFRTCYAADDFGEPCQPLYADDPVQIPLINGEETYEQRWKLSAALQYNPQYTHPQQYADAITINLESLK